MRCKSQYRWRTRDRWTLSTSHCPTFFYIPRCTYSCSASILLLLQRIRCCCYRQITRSNVDETFWNLDCVTTLNPELPKRPNSEATVMSLVEVAIPYIQPWQPPMPVSFNSGILRIPPSPRSVRMRCCRDSSHASIIPTTIKTGLNE